MHPAPAARPRPVWREGLGLALLAAVLRLGHVLGSGGDPTTATPIIDADTYLRLARDFLEEPRLTELLLWQPAAYPVFLAGIFRVCGASVICARVVQALLGGVTCLLAWRLAVRLYGRGVARTAGVLVAVCGPLIFFETRLLATGLAALGATALAALTVAALDRPAIWRFAACGLVGAGAVLVRPTFLPAVLGLAAWCALGADLPRPRRLVGALVMAAVAAAVLVPLELGARAATGTGLVSPGAATINLHLGNNPDLDRTLTVRPGRPWDHLLAAPARAGYGEGPRAGKRYYRDLFRDYVRREPLAFAAGLGRKTVHILCARELPRNQDPLLHRRWSPVLAVTLWRLGPWGFPTGLLLPLAAAGLVLVCNRRAVPVAVVLGLTAAAVVLVFVAARYRAPLLPLLAVCAAAGAHGLVRAVRIRPRDARTLAALAAVAAVALLATLPGPHPQERDDLTGELHFAVGNVHYRNGDGEAAEPHLRRALELEPGQVSARNFLGIILARTGRPDEAAVLFADAVALDPTYDDAANNLQLARRMQAEDRYAHARASETARPDSALALLAEAADLAPRWSEPVARRAWLLATCAVDSLRDGATAELLAVRARTLRGDPHPYLWLVESAARAETGDWDAALEAVAKGLAAAAPADSSWVAHLRGAETRYRRREPLRY